MSDTFIRKWGNSAAVIIPVEELKARNLKIGDEVVVTVSKKGNLREVFGMLKGRVKMTAQEMKDEAREGWG